MPVVKLSHPIKNYGYDNLGARGQSPGNSAVWGDYRFEVNTGVDECDFWVTFESVPSKLHAHVPEGNTVIVLSEPEYVRSYSPTYLSQFDYVVTWRPDVQAPNRIHTYCMDGWWLKKTYDQLKHESPAKTGVVSVVASDNAGYEGHRKRYAFINRMIGHFKDKLDVFGSINGTYWSDKYAALAPYKYSIAIEAAEYPDYWTEKIADCFLSETMPLYYGCPNIDDYVPPGSYVGIDLNDYKASIRAIEGAIDGGAYERSRPMILEAKRRILDELQVFPHLVRVLERHRARSGASMTKRRVDLVPATKEVEPKALGGWQRELLVCAS